MTNPIESWAIAISLIALLYTASTTWADVDALNVHTHAADGSINGIRGWY